MDRHAKVTTMDYALGMFEKKLIPDEGIQAEMDLAWEQEDKSEFFRLVVQLLEIIRRALEDKEINKERGLDGDLNPCYICGKYGSYKVGSGWGIHLCASHKQWWQEEVDKFNGENDGK